jgi:hypothetical protein
VKQTVGPCYSRYVLPGRMVRTSPWAEPSRREIMMLPIQSDPTRSPEALTMERTHLNVSRSLPGNPP